MWILNVHNSCKPKFSARGKLQRVHPVSSLPPGTLDTDSHLVHCRAELSSHQWAETAGCRGAEVRVTAWGTSWGTWWRAASSLSWPHSASSATSPPSVCSETTGSRWRLHSGRYNTEMVLSILILYLSVLDHHYKLGAIADETAILSFVAKYQLLQLIDGPWLWRGRLRTAEQQLWVLWFAGK